MFVRTTEELASVMRGHWRTRVRELGKMGSVVFTETTAVDLYARRMAAATFVVSLYKRVQSCILCFARWLSSALEL